MTFKLPDLVAKCNLCSRHSTEDSIGDECGMPQYAGQPCLGLFEDTRKKKDMPDGDTSESDYAASIIFMLTGMLSDRAKAAQRALLDQNVHSGQSFNAALATVAGIVVADNLTIAATDIEASADLLRLFGRTGDAVICENFVVMLRDHIKTLDPDRP